MGRGFDGGSGVSMSRFDPEQKQERREGRRVDRLVVPQLGTGLGGQVGGEGLGGVAKVGRQEETVMLLVETGSGKFKMWRGRVRGLRGWVNGKINILQRKSPLDLSCPRRPSSRLCCLVSV